MNWLRVFEYSMIFLTGFLSCLLIVMLGGGTEMPLSFSGNSGNINAPSNWIKQSQTHVYDNAVVIDIEKASLSRYASTGSMKPVLDKNSNGIRIIPESEEQIKIGDIVTFEKDNELIIHRVIEKDEDNEGIYFITKGDNSDFSDEKIRFKDIRYVTIGILW